MRREKIMQTLFFGIVMVIVVTMAIIFHGKESDPSTTTSTQTETTSLKLSYSKMSDKLLVNQVTIWNRKLEDLKETSDGVNSSIPKIQGTTTSETN